MYVCVRVWTQNVKCVCGMFMHYLCNTGSSEGHYDSHYIDSKLKLQEFWDAVIDIPPPHDCLHNASEIIISQDDIRGLFSYISSSYALRKRVEKSVRKRKLEEARDWENDAENKKEKGQISYKLEKFGQFVQQITNNKQIKVIFVTFVISNASIPFLPTLSMSMRISFW